jgi:site-specific DNA-methyltransferase (adenine-specific)
MKFLINSFSNKDDIILDFAFGSCSTGVACKELNRSFIGIELDKKYFEIGKKRINL